MTTLPRQVLPPPPAFVITTVYAPFERKWACGNCECGDRKRRVERAGGAASARVDSAGRGSVTGASRGTRSCSSSSVACTRGSRWKRATITSSVSTFASATRVMPWWWAMYAFTTWPRPVSAVRASSTSASVRTRWV